MVLFPNCKINLGLSVINKRSDGYHNLETIFYPLAVKDIIEVIPLLASRSGGQVNFSTSGLKVYGSVNDNLCLKAYYILQKDFPGLPPVSMHLHKAIPMGAGLGGGSADGAFVLKLLNRKFNLGIPVTQLINYAFQLGSDCPFFITNDPCFATGRGEIMEPVSLDLSGYSFVLVNAAISINTGWAFGQLDLTQGNIIERTKSLKDITMMPVDTWKDSLINDFEKPVFEKYPAIKSVKDRLYNRGALYASMTGSGSTVFGIFDDDAINQDFGFQANYWVTKLKAT